MMSRFVGRFLTFVRLLSRLVGHFLIFVWLLLLLSLRALLLPFLLLTLWLSLFSLILRTSSPRRAIRRIVVCSWRRVLRFGVARFGFRYRRLALGDCSLCGNRLIPSRIIFLQNFRLSLRLRICFDFVVCSRRRVLRLGVARFALGCRCLTL